jgi:hypothetical protein
VNQHPIDEAIRTAVHNAVAPVSAGQDLFDRVRTTSIRRQRRTRAATVACGTILLGASLTVALSAGHGSGSVQTPTGPFRSAIGQPDPSDCPTNPDGMSPGPRDGSQEKLAPGTPAEILVCDYVPISGSSGYVLVTGWKLTGDSVSDLVTALNSPLDPVPACTSDGTVGDPHREALFFHLRYDSAPDVVIIANIRTGDPCGDVEGNGELFGVWKNGVPPLIEPYFSGSLR